MQKGSSQVQDFAMSEAEVFVSSCFLLFLFSFFLISKARPREEDSEREKSKKS